MFNGRKIKELIEEKGLAYKDVYESIGMTGTTFFNITSGEGNPKADNLEKLADFLKCPIDIFFERKFSTASTSSDNISVVIENAGEVTLPKRLFELITGQAETIVSLNKKVADLEQDIAKIQEENTKQIVGE